MPWYPKYKIEHNFDFDKEGVIFAELTIDFKDFKMMKETHKRKFWSTTLFYIDFSHLDSRLSQLVNTCMALKLSLFIQNCNIE